MRPKKSLGQHFLKNPAILREIVTAAEIHPEDTVIEIGPGTGTLTDELLAAGAHVIAIEKDNALAQKLKEKYKDHNIKIINEDILKFDPSFFIRHSSFVIVGNIPYYLTGHLVRTVLQTWPMPKTIVLMVQKEVARRMTARPPDMNMLAVLVQLYTKPEIMRIVKRGNFVPVPKVDSAIVRLVPRHRVSKDLDTRCLQIAAQGFKNPRKKLGNNLPKELIEKAGIDSNRRAETLTIQEWKSIADLL